MHQHLPQLCILRLSSLLHDPAPQLGTSAAAAAAAAGGLQAHPPTAPTLSVRPVALGPWQSWRRS